MPRIYRSMKEENGKPMVGRSATALGVRVDGDKIDITPDAEGLVHPNGNGMSVAPSLQLLRSHRIPVRLRHLAPRATGSNALRIWKMGSGPFENAEVAPNLMLRPDSPQHGVVEPAETMRLEAYEEALAATQDQWEIDETGNP